MLPRPQVCDGEFYLGERLLVELSEEEGGQWLAVLRARSGLAPSLLPGSTVCGGFMSDFAVIYGYVAGDQAHSLPIEEPQPGTLDTGLFYAPDNSKGTLLSANLFCANPSCPHIFGPYFSQAVSMIADHRHEELVLGVEGLLSLTCERCGITRLASHEAYEGCYKL